LDEQIRIFSNPDYFLEVWAEKEALTGFIGWWNCGDLRYAEHYAIHPNCRSAGYGSRFLSEWMAESEIPVLLEIEPVVDGITQRRQNFYTRLGFKDNGIVHYQPPYHKETGAVKLWLMSYPQTVSKEDYEKFQLKQKIEIMPSI
jgi:GNAT superfamily N-acetyltransferase